LKRQEGFTEKTRGIRGGSHAGVVSVVTTTQNLSGPVSGEGSKRRGGGDQRDGLRAEGHFRLIAQRHQEGETIWDEKKKKWGLGGGGVAYGAKLWIRVKRKSGKSAIPPRAYIGQVVNCGLSLIGVR